MENEQLVSKEILDILDGKGEQPKPKITGNQIINQEMQKITVPVRTTGKLNA